MTVAERKPIVLLSALAAVFFALTFWAGRVPGLWNSPDETANAFWAERLADRLPLFLQDAAVGLGAGTIHPRSFGVNGDALVPGSFPGLFLLYGALRGLFGLPLEAMTPLLTAFAGLAFYGVLRRLFDARTAFLAAALFYLHPAVIFYSARGLFHNVLLVDLLIFAAALFVLRPLGTAYRRAGWFDDLAGGALVGWAIATRTSEAPWILFGALAFLPLVGRERWKRVALAAAGALLPVLLLASMNALSYESPFRTAYAPPAPPAPTTIEAAPAAAPAAGPSFVLPFGLHPRNALVHSATYLGAIFWWLSALIAVGAASFLLGWRRAEPAQKRYFLVLAALAVWLALLYGSWYVRDHYDPSRVTIGTSYVRYFLPAYVASLPFAALGLSAVAARFRRLPLPEAALLVLAAALSLRIVFLTGDENLLEVRRVLQGNAAKKVFLLQRIPPEAVVITERHDKLLFPERVRIIPALDATAMQAVLALRGRAPVYWYGVRPTAEAYEALAARFAAVGIALEERPSPDPSEALYLIRYAD